MTAIRNAQDEQVVQRLLLEFGVAAGTGLEDVLHQIRALESVPAPTPSGELAALLHLGVDELTGRRWARRHRAGLITLAVVGALSLGASAAAASSPQFREIAQDTVVNLINHYTPFHVDPPQPPAGGEKSPLVAPSKKPSNKPSNKPSPSTGQGQSGESTPDGSSGKSSGQVQSSSPSNDGTSSGRDQSSSPSDKGASSGQDQSHSHSDKGSDRGTSSDQGRPPSGRPSTRPSGRPSDGPSSKIKSSSSSNDGTSSRQGQLPPFSSDETD